MASRGLDSSAALEASPPPRSAAWALCSSLRPRQWTKNLLVFAGLLFGRKLGEPPAIAAALAAFAIFCGLTSAAYLFNDVADRDSDRRHPLKRRRPIAAGIVSTRTAVAAAAILTVVSLGASVQLGWPFAGVALAYGVLTGVYSTVLKHLVILDVLGIATGFVLRAAAGALAVQVAISQWLFVCTILSALFISLAKRRHELLLLEGDAPSHRPILGEYSAYLLDQLMTITAGASLVAYMLYAISPETVAKFGTARLDLTIPFPMYGIFRYLYLVHRREGGGDPADLLIGDPPLIACVVLWALSVVFIIYLQP
jgi:4-hydroxybenzoate polyprenyltransferase